MPRVRRSGTAGLLALAIALGLAGGAPAAGAQSMLFGEKFVLADSVSVAPPGPDSASIVLMREQFVRSRPLAPERIYLDGRPATLLPQRSWRAFPVAAGPHVVSGVMGCPDLELNCRAGRSYVLRMREMIDEGDHWSARLLFDDLSAGRVAIGRGLRHVTTTPLGLEALRRAFKPARARPEGGAPAPLATAETFDEMLIERPLDQVNLKNDFSQLRGRLVVDSTGLHYRLHGRIPTSLNQWRAVADSEDVEIASIVLVRFGGVRFTGDIPWLNVVYRTNAGLGTVSFASFREEAAIDTYNRLFAVVSDRIRATEPEADAEGEAAGPDAPGPGDH